MKYKSSSFVLYYVSKLSSSISHSAYYSMQYIQKVKTRDTSMSTLHNIDLEILTKLQYNDLNDYAYAIKYYAIMIRSSTQMYFT